MTFALQFMAFGAALAITGAVILAVIDRFTK